MAVSEAVRAQQGGEEGTHAHDQGKRLPDSCKIQQQNAAFVIGILPENSGTTLPVYERESSSRKMQSKSLQETTDVFHSASAATR